MLKINTSTSAAATSVAASAAAVGGRRKIRKNKITTNTHRPKYKKTKKRRYNKHSNHKKRSKNNKLKHNKSKKVLEHKTYITTLLTLYLPYTYHYIISVGIVAAFTLHLRLLNPYCTAVRDLVLLLVRARAPVGHRECSVKPPSSLHLNRCAAWM